MGKVKYDHFHFLVNQPIKEQTSMYMDICEVCECHVCFNVSVKKKLSENNIFI